MAQAGMVEELTAHRTAALRIELARHTGVALAATVHAMALPLLYDGAADSCLRLRVTSAALDRHAQAMADCPAHQAMADEAERWGDRLPGEASDLFAWCLAQPQEVLLDLLAFVAALTVDAVQTKQGRGAAHDHADQLATALSLDMRAWWNPSAEGFYQRLTKPALAHALDEAKVPLVGCKIAVMSKAEAVRVTASSLEGTGWLPEVLRQVKVPAPAV